MRETTPSRPLSQRTTVDEALQERIRQYQRARWASHLVWFGIVSLVVLLGGHFLINRRVAFALLVSPGPPFLLHLLQVYQPLSITIGCVGVIGLIQMLLFPVTFTDFLLRRRSLLSTRTLSRWLTRWLQITLSESLSWLVEIHLCYVLLIAQPQTWWLWVPLLLSLYGICFAPIQLLIVYPLCYNYRTITYPKLLRMLHELTIDSGSHMPRIKRIARKTFWRKKPTRIRLWLNGYATGWGKTRTIILTDGALRHCPPSEVRCLLAHELGHLVHHDLQKKWVLYSVILFAAFFIYHVLYKWFLTLLKQTVDFRHPLFFPLLLIILFLTILTFSGTFLIQRAYSRHVEYQADEFALRMTNDVASFKSLKIRMLNLKQTSLRVSLLQELERTHPSTYKRLAHADEFASRQTPSIISPPLKLSKAAISRAWNLPPIRATEVPSTGTKHHITLLSTTKAQYVLRAYRYMGKDRPRIVHEHAIAAYVQARGLPAIAPLPLSSGETILERQMRFYAVYPAASGVQIPREQIIAPEIVAAMGRCLGELHQILAAYPQEGVRKQTFAVDPLATRALLERIEAAISAKADQNAFDQGVLSRLTQQKTWLKTARAVDLTAFLSLEQQVLHGDYQESNLFFTDGRVSAIIV